MENETRAFYRQRERFNALLRAGQGETAEAAGLFYYLNRTGYNGLCRFNGSGEFNVPFGKYSRIQYTRDFSTYREGVAVRHSRRGTIVLFDRHFTLDYYHFDMNPHARKRGLKRRLHGFFLRRR